MTPSAPSLVEQILGFYFEFQSALPFVMFFAGLGGMALADDYGACELGSRL